MAAAIDLKPTGRDNFPTSERRGMQVAIAARGFGLLMRPLGDTLLFVPPLIISTNEIDFLFTNTLKAMETSLN